MMQRGFRLFFHKINQETSQKLLFSNTINLTKVSDLLEKWKERFQENNIPEPLQSIQHILAFNLGTKNVSNFINNFLLAVFIMY